MTLTSRTIRNSYLGTGSSGPFAFTFRVFDPTDVVVFEIVGGVEEELTYGTDYTVTVNKNNVGGSVALTAPLAIGNSLLIERMTPATQPSDFKNQGKFFGLNHEEAYDRTTAVVQQHDDFIENRALQLPRAQAGVVDPMLPEPAAGQVLGWDSLGQAIVNKTPVAGPKGDPGPAGIGGPIPIVANNAARDALYPVPATDNSAWNKAQGAVQRRDNSNNTWRDTLLTREAGPIVGTSAVGAKRDNATDDSGILTTISGQIAAAGTAEIDLGTHLVNANLTLAGRWRPLRGGFLHITGNHNVHFTGTIDKTTTWQWLLVDVGSSVTFDDVENTDPRWWGAAGTGIAGDEAFYNAMVASMAGGPGAAGYTRSKLFSKPGANSKFAATWLMQNKSGLLFDSDIDPRNSNYNEVPLVEWAGAAGGTVIKMDRMRFSKLAGFSVRPGVADVAIDIDGGGAGIGTQCTVERVFVHDDQPGKANFVAFRINISGWANQEYHRLVDAAAWGGQNGTFKEGGHDLAQGLASVDVGSNIITFGGAFLLQMTNFVPWDGGVVNREIHIVGPAGQQLDTTVTFRDATTGTLAVNAPWTNHAAPTAFNRNSSNHDALDGVDIAAGSVIATFHARWLVFGFWPNTVVNKRIQIARADADISEAALAVNSSTATTLTRTGANWKENQWKGLIVNISSGTGAGQQREILSNTDQVLTWTLPLVTALDGTSNFQILTPKTLDTTISYLNATQGTLAVAPKITIGGTYFFLGEGLGRGLQVGTNFNTKGIRTERVDTFYFYIAHEITGGSHHSDYDNHNQNMLCYAVGGAISEPITISRMNGEGNLSIFRNDTFVPVFIWGSRWAPDRVEPGGSLFKYAPAATCQIMLGNSIDTAVGGMPRGSKVHNFSKDGGVDARLLSIGNEFPFTDADLGYDTLSESTSATGYVLSVLEPSPTANWVVRGFTRNRNPGATRFGLAWMFDGWVFRGARKVAPDLGDLREGQTVESADPATGMITEDTRIDDKDLTNLERGTLVKRFRMPNTQDTVRNVGGSWNIDGKQGRLLGDCTAGDIFLGLPSNLPVGWEATILKLDNTNNIFNVSAGGGGTFNGAAGLDLVGQYTCIHVRVRTNVAGVNAFDCRLMHLGFRKIAFDWPNVAAGASGFNNFAVKGTKLGAEVRISIELDTQDMVLTARASATDTVRARMRNDTAGGIDLANADHRIWVNPFI
jgi:hypothetical protein